MLQYFHMLTACGNVFTVSLRHIDEKEIEMNTTKLHRILFAGLRRIQLKRHFIGRSLVLKGSDSTSLRMCLMYFKKYWKGQLLKQAIDDADNCQCFLFPIIILPFAFCQLIKFQIRNHADYV